MKVSKKIFYLTLKKEALIARRHQRSFFQTVIYIFWDTSFLYMYFLIVQTNNHRHQ